MPFDQSTLLAIVVFTAAVGGCLLLLSWLQHRDSPALALWGVSFLMSAVSAALFAARGDIPDVWSIVVSNAIGALAYGVLWSGVRTFEHQPVSLPVAAAGVVTWLAACTIHPIYASPWARATIMTAIIMVYLLMALFELWRARGEALMSRWPIMALLAGHAVLMPIRIPLAGSLVGARLSNVNLLAFVAFEAVFITICAAYLLGSVVKERVALRYKQASLSDPLTGVANRRAFLRQGTRLITRARYARQPVALLLFDLDRFKEVNDQFGHEAGDIVIAAFCRVATSLLRPGDLFARIGGEEFACLIADTSLYEAALLADRVRAAYQGASHDFAGSSQAATVSVGVAMADDKTRSLEALLASADRALYRAKENGRNRVELAGGVSVIARRDLGAA
jgi:diguanylate cyclase (GGDEF)-like protein